jgi:hypothetical protein
MQTPCRQELWLILLHDTNFQPQHSVLHKVGIQRMVEVNIDHNNLWTPLGRVSICFIPYKIPSV